MIVIHSFGPKAFSPYFGVEVAEVPLDQLFTHWLREDGREQLVPKVDPDVDDTLPDQAWLTWSWMSEDSEPWRVSRKGAFRVKFSSKRALHIGVCKRGDPTNHELSAEDFEKYAPWNIGRWGLGLDEEVSGATGEETAEAV